MTKGQRIKQRREELNLKQIELAEKVHISKQTLYKYENDIITNIPSNKLEEIASALETTPDYLMGWKLGEKWEDYVETQKLMNVLDERIQKHKERANEFYVMYENASPEIQSAVELLLKSAQHSSESRQNN